MTFFENILKKRLGDATSNKGVAPDDLWAAIEENLPPKEEKHTPFKWTVFGLAVLMVILTAGVSVSIFLEEEEPKVSATIADQTVNEPKVKSGERATKEVLEVDKESKGTASAEAGNITATNTQQLKDKRRASSHSDFAIGVSVDKTQRTTEEPLIKLESGQVNLPATRKYESVADKIVADDNTAESTAPEILINRENIKGNEVRAESDEVDAATMTVGTDASKAVAPRNAIALRKLDVQVVIAPLIQERKEPTVENFKSILPIKRYHRPRIDLGIFVGTNMLRQKYPSAATDDLADVLNASRGEALGQSASLEIGYRLKPGLKMYTGIELLKTHTTFRYTQQWDTVTMRNGRQIDAIAIRRVQHNNRQTLLSVPLMLEKTFASERWEVGLAAGVSINYLTQQSGRSLNALQQVVTYGNGNGGSLPAPNFYLSYQLRPSVNYRLNNRVSVQVRADLRLQQYGKSALYQLSNNSMLYGGSLGVVFGL